MHESTNQNTDINLSLWICTIMEKWYCIRLELEYPKTFPISNLNYRHWKQWYYNCNLFHKGIQVQKTIICNHKSYIGSLHNLLIKIKHCFTNLKACISLYFFTFIFNYLSNKIPLKKDTFLYISKFIRAR